jgi:hypothetical protein
MGLGGGAVCRVGVQDDGCVLAHAEQEIAIGMVKTKTTVCASGVEMWLMLLNYSALGFVGALLSFGAIEAELHSS